MVWYGMVWYGMVCMYILSHGFKWEISQWFLNRYTKSSSKKNKNDVCLKSFEICPYGESLILW